MKASSRPTWCLGPLRSRISSRPVSIPFRPFSACTHPRPARFPFCSPLLGPRQAPPGPPQLFLLSLQGSPKSAFAVPAEKIQHVKSASRSSGRGSGFSARPCDILCLRHTVTPIARTYSPHGAALRLRPRPCSAGSTVFALRQRLRNCVSSPKLRSSLWPRPAHAQQAFGKTGRLDGFRQADRGGDYGRLRGLREHRTTRPPDTCANRLPPRPPGNSSVRSTPALSPKHKQSLSPRGVVVIVISFFGFSSFSDGAVADIIL